MSQRLTSEIILNLNGNLANKAKRYSRQMENMGVTSRKAFQMMNTSARAASRGIDTLGNRTIFGAGIAAVAFERTFIQTKAQFERYQIMLNELQGSESAGAEAFQWIKEFTQNTPYALNEVTQSFVKMKAFGIDPMNGSMQAIVDQAARMGGTAETVEGITLALGQAWTKGKLQGEEALQLLERGVPVWDYLVKASKDAGENGGLGFDATELQEMASKGRLTRKAIAALIDEMGEASEGAAKAQMDTWSGMTSNMGDHWKLFQDDVMSSGAFDVLKGELSEFLSELDRMKESGEYDEYVASIGQGLVDAIHLAKDMLEVVQEVGEGLYPVIKLIAEGIQAGADALGGYGNLAKILATIYAINKAVRISSPVLQGGAVLGGWALDKVGRKGGKMGKAAGLFSKMGAMPVFVTNMPPGFGGGADVVPGSGGKGNKSPRTGGVDGGARNNSYFSQQKPKPKAHHVGKSLAGSLGVLGLLFMAEEYDSDNQAFKPASFPELEKANNPESPAPEVAQAMERFNQAYKKEKTSPWANAGQRPDLPQSAWAQNGGKLRISVHSYHDGRAPDVSVDTSELPGAAMED